MDRANIYARNDNRLHASSSSSRSRSPNRSAEKYRGLSPRKTDKSLLDILSEMSKVPASNEPGDSNNSGGQINLPSMSTNRLDGKGYGNNYQQEYSKPANQPKTGSPSIQSITSTRDISIGNQRLSASSSPKPVMKFEYQMKKEDADELDELSKMMMILHGDSPSKHIPHSPIMAHKLSPQPVPPVYNIKHEMKVEVKETEKHQRNLSLSEQLDEYVKKAELMKAKIATLMYQRDELRGDGQRLPSPDTKVLLKENTKLQLVHQNKLKNINNLIDMLNGIIGENTRKVNVLESADRNPMRESKSSPGSRFNYVFYDSELHWCRVCNIFPPTATDYLNHLHSQDHKSKVVAAYMEAPWHSVAGINESFPTYPLAETKRTPIRGLQFFVPSTAWYCKLCDRFIGDLHCASAHLKSITHSKNYTTFVQENPHWESDWMLDRQKALEEMRVSSSLQADDMFNIESIHSKCDDSAPVHELHAGKYSTRENKYLSNISSTNTSDSDSDSKDKDANTGGKAVSKDGEDNMHSKKVSALKRLEPLIKDRKLLENINSVKIPNRMSPPRAYRTDRVEDRREERRGACSDLRRNDRRFDRCSAQRGDRRSERHGREDRRSERHGREDRRSERRENRHSERSEGRSSERSEGRRSERREDRRSERREDKRSVRFDDRSSVQRENSCSEQRKKGSEELCIRSSNERQNDIVNIDLPDYDEKQENSRSDQQNSSPDETKIYENKKSVLIGKILPFKIEPLQTNKEQAKMEQKIKYLTKRDEEEAKNRKKEMDAEIQIKVEEFKKKLSRIQAECEKTEKLAPEVPIRVPQELDMNLITEMAQQILAMPPSMKHLMGIPDLCSLGNSLLGLPSHPGVPLAMSSPSPLNLLPNMGIPPLMGMQPFMPPCLPMPPRMPMQGLGIRPFFKNEKRKSLCIDLPSTRSKHFKVEDKKVDEDNDKNTKKE